MKGDKNAICPLFYTYFLYHRTFIIEKQPPQVLKIQTKFGVVVR